MKKMIFIFLSLLILNGCDYKDKVIETIPRGGYDDSYNWNCVEIDSLYNSTVLYGISDESEQLKQIKIILSIVRDNIIYTHDSDVWDIENFWQLPEITWKLKTGDCEDFAILSMYLINKYLGIKGEIYRITNGVGHVILVIPFKSDKGNKMYINYDNISYNFNKYTEQNYYIRDIISYEETIWICKEFAKEVSYVLDK
jgi:predicted transglutaminase-like cysteine proteinase